MSTPAPRVHEALLVNRRKAGADRKAEVRSEVERLHVREPAGVCVRGAVLVVDDQAAQRLLVTTVLEQMAEARFVVREAATAVRALAVLESLPPDAPVLVLTDAVMPGMDGVSLVRTARERFRDRCVRYVLFTAHEGERFADVQQEWGLDAVATKPVGIDALRAVLGEQVDAWLRMG